MAESIGKLPPASSLPACSRAVQEAVLALLFEPSPALNDSAVPLLSQKAYASYPDMIDAVGESLESLQSSGDLPKLEEILASHPRLGEKKVESALSRAEQAAMVTASTTQSGQDLEKEAEILRGLN